MEAIVALAILMGVLAATDMATDVATDKPQLVDKVRQVPPCDVTVHRTWPSCDLSEPIYRDLTLAYDQQGDSEAAPTAGVPCDE